MMTRVAVAIDCTASCHTPESAPASDLFHVGGMMSGVASGADQTSWYSPATASTWEVERANQFDEPCCFSTLAWRAAQVFGSGDRRTLPRYSTGLTSPR